MDAHDKFVKTPSLLRDDDFKYQTWFDKSSTKEAFESKAYIDFMHNIFMHDSYKYVGDPSKATVLEIGVGGGRLAIPASYVFGNVVGIDVHSALDVTRQHIANQGRTNVQICHFDETSNIEDKSIDFAYSFITFQHFTNWNVSVSYLELLQRVLKPGAFANLYFATHAESCGSDVTTLQVPHDTSDFVITMTAKTSYVKCELERHGFTIIDTGVVKKRPWMSQNSSQTYFRFTK